MATADWLQRKPAVWPSFAGGCHDDGDAARSSVDTCRSPPPISHLLCACHSGQSLATSGSVAANDKARHHCCMPSTDEAQLLLQELLITGDVTHWFVCQECTVMLTRTEHARTRTRTRTSLSTAYKSLQLNLQSYNQ